MRNQDHLGAFSILKSVIFLKFFQFQPSLHIQPLLFHSPKHLHLKFQYHLFHIVYHQLTQILNFFDLCEIIAILFFKFLIFFLVKVFMFMPL